MSHDERLTDEINDLLAEMRRHEQWIADALDRITRIGKNSIDEEAQYLAMYLSGTVDATKYAYRAAIELLEGDQ